MTLVGILIVLLSYLSFQGDLYAYLLPRLGVGWAYAIDQGLPLLIAVIATVVVLRGRVRVVALWKEHKIIVIALLLAVLIAHGWVLRYYFFAEDVSTILNRVTNGNINFPFDPSINGYPFASFVASFLLFGTNAWLYNIVTLCFFILSALLLYWVVYLLSRSRLLSTVAALYFATTPIILDVFSWQANAQGMPLVLGIHLASFLGILFYKRSRQPVYVLLSLLFFAAALKMGFVRIAGLVFPLIFLIWIPSMTKIPIYVKIVQSIAFGVVWMGFVAARLVPGGLQGFFQSLAAPQRSAFRWDGYWERLSYYMAHLVFPNTLGATLFPTLKDLIGRITAGQYVPQSIVWLLGIFAIAVFAVLGVVALVRPKKTSASWLLLFSVSIIFGSMFYVPFYIVTTSNLALFDQYFIRSSPPYGPGARYVFSAAPGVSILFAMFLSWLGKKKQSRVLAGAFLVAAVVGNTALSIKLHRAIIVGISNPERTLISKFFAMVPRDGKPKLVYSVNSQRNAIDNNVSGWHWLYGFYKQNELIYSNDLTEVRELLASGRYGVNQLYAFYTNPETRVFTDVSHEARRELFVSANDQFAQPSLPVQFSPDASQSQIQAARRIEGLFVSQRPVFTSPELSYRILSPSQLHLRVEVAPLLGIPYPFSDTVFPSRVASMPQQLWWMMRQNPPLVVHNERELETSLSLLSFDDRPLTDIAHSDRLSIARIQLLQERIRRGLRVWVSNIFSEDIRSTPSSLVDGLFDADPAPMGNDTYYFAKDTPTTITLQLASPITLGRILLNTPKSMVSDHLPTNVTILASLRGGPTSVVGTLTQETENNWSPNNGAMLMIPTKQIPVDSVSVVISKTTGEPAILDEIMVDPAQSLAFTPAQLLEAGEKNFWYVDSDMLLQELTAQERYRILTLAYACAEEVDWVKQKRNVKMAVPGVWQLVTVPMPALSGTLNTDVALDCHGSVLRQVTLIGPMYPSRIWATGGELR